MTPIKLLDGAAVASPSGRAWPKEPGTLRVVTEHEFIFDFKKL